MAKTQKSIRKELAIFIVVVVVVNKSEQILDRNQSVEIKSGQLKHVFWKWCHKEISPLGSRPRGKFCELYMRQSACPIGDREEKEKERE